MTTALGRSSRYPLFDVIRLGAALLVIFSHAFTTTGLREPQPVHFSRLGITWGHLGVAVFFVTSGFLVTQSWMRRPQAGGYLLRRGLRIWPAYLAVILLSVFVVGLMVTDLPAGAYLTDPHTWAYLLHNAVMAPIVFVLPGVFRHQPLNGVNGSFWTLPYEVLAYVVLLALAIVRVLRASVVVALLILGLVLYQLSVATHAIDLPYQFNGMWLTDVIRLEVWFLAGMLMALLADRVVGHWGLAAAALVATVVGLHQHWALAAIPGLAVLVIWVGTLPCRRAECLHRLGDPSYGMYLSGFLLQQLLVWSGIVGHDPWLCFLSGAVLATMFGFASWHLIERRAMRLAGRRRGPTPEADAPERELVGVG